MLWVCLRLFDNFSFGSRKRVTFSLTFRYFLFPFHFYSVSYFSVVFPMCFRIALYVYPIYRPIVYFPFSSCFAFFLFLRLSAVSSVRSGQSVRPDAKTNVQNTVVALDSTQVLCGSVRRCSGNSVAHDTSVQGRCQKHRLSTEPPRSVSCLIVSCTEEPDPHVDDTQAGRGRGRRFWKVTDYFVSSDSPRDRFKSLEILEDFDSRPQKFVECVLALGER